MDAATGPRRRPAGISRLLEHCDALARVTGDVSSTARSRLETELGSDLARRLVGALARRRGDRAGLLLG